MERCVEGEKTVEIGDEGRSGSNTEQVEGMWRSEMKEGVNQTLNRLKECGGRGTEGETEDDLVGR